METPFKCRGFPPDEIDIPPHRMRELNPDKARELAESIKKIGQLSPIIVRETGHGVELVTGLHRMEAVRILGDRHVTAFVVKCDDIEARKAEIAENLHRAELTVQERADHIAEWVKLTDETVKAQVAPLEPHKRGRPDQGINSAVRELGIDRTEAQRAVKIASIEPEAKAAAKDAGLDNNQSALMRVAKEKTAEAQLVAIQRERDLAGARKLNSNANAAIALTEAQLFAHWLMERTDLHELPQIISWLEGCKPKAVIAALRREAHT